MRRLAKKKMLSPWVHPRSSIYWFRRRVPAKYLKFGMPTEIRFSLETRIWEEAVALCAEHNLRLEREWKAGLVGEKPTQMSFRQIAGLAGEFYRETIGARSEEPGKPLDIQAELSATKRRRFPPPGIPMHDGHLYGSFSEEARRFLTEKGIILVGDRLKLFLEAYVDAKSVALEELLENANGKYKKNPAADDFPAYDRPADPAHQFDVLWDDYKGDVGRALAASTVKRWLPCMESLMSFAGTRDMSRVTEKHILGWRDNLLDKSIPRKKLITPKTVRFAYIAAAQSFFGWAKRNSRLPSDPAAEVHVEVVSKKAIKMRGFRDDEAATILSAALAPMSEQMTAESRAARRWVPWLCAYTGARVNEMTQLRAMDVHTYDGIWCVHIRPEAGTVKTLRARSVPIHPHLVEQGFLEFAAQKQGETPLFYAIERQRKKDRKNPTYTSVGNKLASWVREDLEITDPTVAPNHGWRHRFKTVARKAGLDAEKRDAIQGHAPRTEGENYGEIPPDVMLPEILKLPRYEVEPGELRDGRRRKAR
ncbi:integrase [Tardiphaga alba]|uniref:Integrase n=2 Tax=Tardiphaga alba TaxID=340268 RepID=A0ABX8AEC9_9BRAD|nr:integrase [Tardiphaga alba]